MEIIPLGDSALIIRVGAEFGHDPEAALHGVLETQRRVEAAAIPGILECAPAYDSVGVFFDPLRVSEASAHPDDIFEWLKGELSRTISRPPSKDEVRTPPRLVEIPVCYEGGFAPDLPEVARHTGLSPSEVVRRHAAPEYRVHCVGFVPGFPYLGGLPKELATPRRATPRLIVPPGSVGIGGAQTGIYPASSPGGWNLIGRTPLKLFDAQIQPPALLSAGDRVRFRAITREEFEKL